MSEKNDPVPPVEHQFQPGVSGNPNGRPKGRRNLATVVRDLEAEDFDWSLVPIKQKELAGKIGNPWKAIVYTALAKAMSGDIKAMEWLRKSGYGDKLDITSDGKVIQAPLVMPIIKARQPEQSEDIPIEPDQTT